MPSRLRDRARELRRDETEAERALWKLLRNRRLTGAKCRRQHPIGPFVADLCCIEAKLVIELDGGPHTDQADYDRERTRHLEARGYKVIRFWNNEISVNPDGVLRRIGELLRLRAENTAIEDVAPPLPHPRGRGTG